MRAADQPHDRGEVDDRPLPRRQHVAAGRAGAEEAAVEVDRHDLAPALGRQLGRRHARAEAGIVDQDVDPAVPRGDLLHHRVDPRLVDHVQPVRLAAPDLARHRLGGSKIDVGHRDMGAGLRQRLRGRAPDAVAAAGHHRDPPVEAQQLQIVRHPRPWLKHVRSADPPRQPPPIGGRA